MNIDSADEMSGACADIIKCIYIIYTIRYSLYVLETCFGI